MFLFFAALAGGALNSVAGGGSFVALPALLYAGVSPVVANATTTLALWPGSVSSAVAYRREIRLTGSRLAILSAVSLVGGLLGAMLLVRTSDTSFMRLLPWLMLAAAVTFTFGGRRTATEAQRYGDQSATESQSHRDQIATESRSHRDRIATESRSHGDRLITKARRHGDRLITKARRHGDRHEEDPTLSAFVTLWPKTAASLRQRDLAIVAVIQFAIAIYGGYFGGGMGIMMLATLAISGMTDVHEMNGLKAVLGAAINGVALLEFIASGSVAWAPGLVMAGGGIIGGYAGASAARRLARAHVRQFVVVTAWVMTVYFFVR